MRRPAILLIWLLMSFTHHATAKTRSWRLKETMFGTGIATASTLIQYHDTCVLLQVFFISGEFFKGLQKKETPTGLEFSKDKTPIQHFPDRLIVDVDATVYRCNPRPNEIILPDYASGLMTGASFEVNWKTGTQERPAVLASKDEYHPHGLRWDYFLEVPAKDVPLTDELLINMSLRHGIIRMSLVAGLDTRRTLGQPSVKQDACDNDRKEPYH